MMICPSCGSTDTRMVLETDGLPVLCNTLADSAEDARSCPRGDMHLCLCSRCSLLFNAIFDIRLLSYDTGYETSLHFSAVFREYAKELARTLVDRLELRERPVIEIGCGRGEFLKILHEEGCGECHGYDESHLPGLLKTPSSVHLHATRYPQLSDAPHGDLVCCRHVLEHVPNPDSLLPSLRSALAPSGVIYLEVPNALFTLHHLGIWDLIYEHCCYYTQESLWFALSNHGLQPMEIRSTYAGQFLSALATADDGPPRHTSPKGSCLIDSLCSSFTEARTMKIRRFDQLLEDSLLKHETVAIWGAGSKGVTFLNTLHCGEELEIVVDSNPRKQGMHIPGTGQKIIAPEDDTLKAVSLVFLMNPIYMTEVKGQLEDIRSRAKLICA